MNRKGLLKLSLLMVVVLACAASGCKKTNPNAEYAGTYAGTTKTTSTGSITPDTLVITTGSSSNSIVILEKASGAVGTATVSGGTITIPSQNVAVNGGSYPMSGAGALSGNSLTINWTENIAGINSNFVFSGIKQ